MRVQAAKVTRVGVLVLGLVWVGAGLLIALASALEPWAFILGAALVAGGIWMLWRAPRLGLQLGAERGRLVGALWSRTFARSSIRAISEWPPIVELAEDERAGSVQLLIFHAPGGPHLRGATFTVRRDAVKALSDWSGIPVEEAR